MKKVKVIISLVILGILITGFSNSKTSTEIDYQFTEGQTLSTVLTKEESSIDEVNIPFVGKTFTGFKEALAFKESQGKYFVVNTLGYLGKYQFGKTTLERFRIYNTNRFLSSPQLQEDAFIALCSLNKWILRKDIKRSVGKVINGIEITESGILAAAHLSGAGNVKKFLRSNGEKCFKDAFGSSIQHYLAQFSGYDTSFIEASRKPVL
jgi:hypothetical protein